VAYDEQLAAGIDELIGGEEGVTQKRMFGGLAFLIHGNLAVAASGQGGLMVRVERERTDELLNEPGARPFEMRGREMKGWLRVDADAIGSEGGLEKWVGLGVDYARSLPPK